MKNLVLATIALLSVNLGQAQWWGSEKVKGNGEVTTKTISTEPYDKISIAGNFDVTLVEGTEGKITVEAEANLFEYMEIEAKKGKLKVGARDGYELKPSSGNKILVKIPVEAANEINLAGSGSVVSNMVLRGDFMEFNLAGSGDMALQADATEIEANIAGSGDIKLKGKAKAVDANIAGSGDIEGYDMDAGDVKANIAGSGDVMITCNGMLEANIVGSGDVIYQGNPTKEKTSSMGSGDVKRKG